MQQPVTPKIAVPAAKPPRPPPEAATERPAPRAEQAAQAVVADARLRVAVLDRSTGALVTSQNADEPVPCMSVVKLLLVLDVLRDTPGTLPEPGVSDTLQHMLAHSDDDMASLLWQSRGGPDIVTRAAAELGLARTAPPADPSRWGDTTTTALDIVTVYRYIADRLPPAQRELILGALAQAPRFAEDGFDQYFGIPDGLSGVPWAIKQGWGTSGPQAVMNSTGLVGTGERYVVVITATASADSYTDLPRAVTAAAKTLTELRDEPP